MNDYNNFLIAAEEIIVPAAHARADEWRLLRRLHLPARLNDPQGGAVKRALVLDVETTGLSLENDEVIQLAMLPFTYEVETGLILEIDRNGAFEGLREPGVPISEEATFITGISADMLAGKSIVAADVDAIVTDADLVIAHNAYFDRPMVERHWSCFAGKPWGCTLTSIDWLREGFAAGKLDYLGMQFGWFYNNHRALADCEACLALLGQSLPQSGRRIMHAVCEASLREEFRNLVAFSTDGAIHFACMDWRHMQEILDASEGIYSELKNLCVWAKTNAGMGSFYRSQHELVFVFKAGRGRHINNFGLGEKGRHRSNLWTYAGVNTFRQGRMDDLTAHPTVKPTAMVADAILDCSKRGGVVLDAFAGSGATLIAVERTGRQGRAIEIDPAYVDLCVRRLETETGARARLVDGAEFPEVAKARLGSAEAV